MNRVCQRKYGLASAAPFVDNPTQILFSFSHFQVSDAYLCMVVVVGTENRRKSVTKFMQKKKFEKFVEKVCYDAWWHQKEEEEERVIRRRPKYYLLGLLAVDTLFENHPKCRLWIFQFGPFQPIFVPLKLTCRFARHVECDFWGDFPPLWSSLSEAAMHSYTLRGQCVDVNRAADPFGILLSFNILCRAYTYYTDFVLQSNTT